MKAPTPVDISGSPAQRKANHAKRIKRRRIYKRRKRQSRKLSFALAIAIAAILVLSSVIGYSILNSLPHEDTTILIPALRAAIVDHLSSTFPNQTFIQITTDLLKGEGFTVDYYPHEEVTVELYKNLPTLGYRLLILRVHSALSTIEGSEDLALFTSESYSETRYAIEQVLGQVVQVTYYEEAEFFTPDSYFGISQELVKSGMYGRFYNTTVIMMGCSGLTFTQMADAFIQKGAGVYIGWSLDVSSSHTDKATSCLLQHLICERQPIDQAIGETMRDVGIDTTFNSTMLYYPLSAKNDRILD